MQTDTTGWTEFRHGDLRGLVVNDGRLKLGPPQRQFPGRSEAEIAAVIAGVGSDPGSFEIEQNVLVLELDGRLVMFDAGVGTAPDWGARRFGDWTGKLVERLSAAGIGREDIDVIALTHAHPDHAWGLVDAAGRRVFPRARLAVARRDVEHFMAGAAAGEFADPGAADRYLGARRCLQPYLDDAQLLEDGDVVVRGVAAQATPGHTPGHLVFRVADPAGDLIFWGDLCHHRALLREPAWATGFDHDGAAAAAQRQAVLAGLAADDAFVLSYHFPFPGYGRVQQDADGYGWLPLPLGSDVV